MLASDLQSNRENRYLTRLSGTHTSSHTKQASPHQCQSVQEPTALGSIDLLRLCLRLLESSSARAMQESALECVVNLLQVICWR